MSSKNLRLDKEDKIENLEKKEEFLLELPSKYENIVGIRLKNHPKLLKRVLKDFDHIKNKNSDLFKKREPKTNKRK